MSLALACLLTGVPLTGLPEVQGTLARAGDGRGNQLRMLMPSASGSDATVSVQEGSLSKRTSTVTIAAGGSLGHGFYGLSQEAEAAAGPRPQVARAFSQLAPATRGLVHVSPGEGSNDGSRSLAASRRASGANNSALGTSPRVGSRVGSLKEEAGAGRRRADEDAEMTDLEAGLVEELRIGAGRRGKETAQTRLRFSMPAARLTSRSSVHLLSLKLCVLFFAQCVPVRALRAARAPRL